MVERKKIPIYLLVAVLWCNDYLLQYVRIVVARMPIIGSLSVFVIPGIYAIAILFALPLLKVYASDVVLVCIVWMIYVVSPVVHPETYSTWSDQALKFLFTVVPFYFLGNMVLHYIKMERLLEYLATLSIVTVLAKMTYFAIFEYGRSNAWTDVGEMDQAYKLLPHICMICYDAIKKPTVTNLSVVAISSAYLLFLGNRGSVLVLIICIAMLYLLTSSSKYRVWNAGVIVAVVLLVVFSPFFDVMVETLENAALQLGMSVRIFEKIKEGGLTDSSGRDVQAESIYTALENQPMRGLGLYGDRVLNGTYAHSIVRELWVDFGYLFGSLIFALIVWIIFRAFKDVKSKEIKAFTIILMGNGFFKLFFSGSYLTEDTFFYVIGMCVAMIRYSKKINQTTKKNMERTRLYGEW